MSPGSRRCEVCGADLRPRCAQGHRSALGASFCETCGQPLLATDTGPATADIPVLDYTDASFAELILSAGEEADRGGAGQPPGGAEASGGGESAPANRGPRPLGGDSARATVHGRGWRMGAEEDSSPGLDGAGGFRDFGGMVRAGRDAGRRRSARGAARGAARWAKMTLAATGVAAVAAGAVFALRGRPLPASASLAGPASHHFGHGRGSGRLPARPLPGLRVGTSGWTAPTPVTALPSGAAITALDCPAADACFAADSAGDLLTSASPGSWKVAATDWHSPVAAIGCASAQFCVALDRTGGALIDKGGAWGSPVYVDNRSGAFTSVSCPSTRFCMATDNGGNAFAYNGTAGEWAPFSVDALGSGLSGVSCASADHCVAVDSGGGVYTYAGRAWASAPAAVDVGRAFTAVSCASPSFCAAIDDTGRAAVLSGGAWHVGPLGTTAEAVDCPAAGQCEAVDDAGGAVRYANGVWSHPAGVDGQIPFSALTCPAADFCVAADHSGDVLYYAPRG